MHIALIGRRRMGGNMRARLRAAGTAVTGSAPDQAVSDGPDVAALVAALRGPRIIWVMVPAGDVTEAVITALAARLGSGDLIIDGGNTRYHDNVRRAQELGERG